MVLTSDREERDVDATFRPWMSQYAPLLEPFSESTKIDELGIIV